MNAYDLSGLRFGRLVALSVTRVHGQRKWICQCDCGNTAVVSPSKLTSGHTRSCGCLQKERISQACRKDYSGYRFGRLLVLERISEVGQSARYKCLCDCGKYTDVLGGNLVTGATKSCGCFRSETTTRNYTKHGGCYDRLYKTWLNMKNRCLNPNNKEYHVYGGRGITVCQEWLNDFAQFRSWAEAAGYTDEMQIDRIDNNKGYTPSNCQWLTAAEHIKKTNQDRKRSRETFRLLCEGVGV